MVYEENKFKNHLFRSINQAYTNGKPQLNIKECLGHHLNYHSLDFSPV